MKSPVLGAVALLGLLGGVAAQASAVYYTIDLRGSPPGASPTPFIELISSPADTNGDSWFETVMKINLNDPGQLNPYKFAEFRIHYDGAPTGLSVNIGDSATNNGGSGDSGTQSNDAELQIGALMGSPASEYQRFQVLGNDNTPPGQKVQADVAGLGTQAHDVYLTIGNEYAAWNAGPGLQGSVTSPYLYALNGQADSEGPVNYDIYAAFNRVISGPGDRLGSGVGLVTVCLSDDASCFNAVPSPGTLSLAMLGLLGLATSRARWQRVR
jgi:hypothetical protein